MFAKFKLNEIEYSALKKYEESGKKYYKDINTEIQKSLKEFIGIDGVIDGTKLQENWFPVNGKFDVFLSHSHNDEKLAISLAGFLKEELGLKTFIDSCLWGYSNDLLKEIDEKYCMHSNGISFDYDKRNYSTSHVHMMLSIALSRMIDNCEAVFFLNSENSILLSEEIRKERTSSPWIYNELCIADIIQMRPIEQYRKPLYTFAKETADTLNERASLNIKYEVDIFLNNFIDLYYDDLITCVESWKKNDKSYQSPLDYIYLLKNDK